MILVMMKFHNQMPYTLSQTGNIAQYGLTESTYGSAVYGSTGSDLIRQAVEGSGFTVAVKY